jgi:hypothetical protein
MICVGSACSRWVRPLPFQHAFAESRRPLGGGRRLHRGGEWLAARASHALSGAAAALSYATNLSAMLVFRRCARRERPTMPQEIIMRKWCATVYAPPPPEGGDADPFPWLLVIFERSTKQVFAYPTEAEARAALAQVTLAHSRALADREKRS